MSAFCIQYHCFTTIFQFFTFSIYDFLILRAFVIFCNSSINVYYWQIYTYVSSAPSDCSFNNNHRYYNLFLFFSWICLEFISVFSNQLTSEARDDITIITSFSNFFLSSHYNQTILLFFDFLRAFCWQYIFI